MFLLVGEFTGFFNFITDSSLEGSFLFSLGKQFHHHPWNGLRFWDLVQPYFMFIVGLSLPFAVQSRIRKGQDTGQIRTHVIKRSIVLFLLGWGLYCIGPGQIVFRFQNVLAQIAVTYLVAFFIMHRTIGFQLLVSVVILVANDLIYRLFPVEGFDQAYVAGQNFGTWLDLQYGGADLHGYWVSFNAFSTSAHTIWGVVTAQFLLKEESDEKKLRTLILAGLGLVAIGYALDAAVPIIKRIATSSFVLVSGGWTLLTLVVFYWVIEVKKAGSMWSEIFIVVGTNSLFIYLFAHVGGADLVTQVLTPFSGFIFGWSGNPWIQVLTSLTVWATLWGICYWLDTKRIYIKI